MVDSQSKVYAPAYAKEMNEQQKKGVKNPAPDPTADAANKKVKTEPTNPPTPATAASGSTTQLSAALQQMLAAAKVTP
jgi:hypothetical protein